MSSATLATRNRRTSSTKLLIGFLLVIAAGVALAWFGAGALRSETTASGLQFRTVTAGTGEPIAREDLALVEYEGRLDDGTVFDSSATHGGAQPMSPMGMIPGFAEAMLMMREGGEYRVKIPPHLAYGDQPPPGLPAGSSLNFDVKIQKVARGAGAMMQQMQQQGQAQQPQQELPQQR
jgi:FKBP-type peptidyl-prolyl cis-trans isomerase FkpA